MGCGFGSDELLKTWLIPASEGRFDLNILKGLSHNTVLLLKYPLLKPHFGPNLFFFCINEQQKFSNTLNGTVIK
jgi:hypothetical protein